MNQPFKINFQLHGAAEDEAAAAAETARLAAEAATAAAAVETARLAAEEEAKKNAKNFSQEDLNKIAAKEKRDGRASVLKSLGLEDGEGADAELAKFKAWADSQKTATELAAELAKTESKKASDNEMRAVLAETKIAVLSKGANPDFLDDLIALVSAKTTADSKLDDVVEELKKKYPSFFEASAANGGTGSSFVKKTAPATAVGMGARLAAQQSTQVKSSYFN